AIHTIQNVATTQKPRRGHVALAQQADIQIPVGQLSIKSFARYFRQLLEFPDHQVTGEITRDGDAFTLQLRHRVGSQMALARSLTAAQRTRVGWCNVMLGRYRLAFRHFRRVLATRRRHVYATLGLAVCYWRLHRYREAVSAFETFFRLRGPGWTGSTFYTCALLDVGRVDDAVQTAEDLYARYPDESSAMASLARVRLHQGRLAEAAAAAEAGT